MTWTQRARARLFRPPAPARWPRPIRLGVESCEDRNAPGSLSPPDGAPPDLAAYFAAAGWASDPAVTAAFEIGRAHV